MAEVSISSIQARRMENLADKPRPGRQGGERISLVLVVGVTISLLVLLFMPSAGQASFDTNGLSVELSPREWSQGVETPMVLTIYNDNTTSFNVTSVNIQGKMGLVYNVIASRYPINGSEGFIPAGGSVDIELTGNTSFVGEVTLLISVRGLDVDGEIVIITFYDQARVLPVEMPTILGLDPGTFIALLAVTIAAIAVASYLFSTHNKKLYR